jgi:hypothetical protein
MDDGLFEAIFGHGAHALIQTMLKLGLVQPLPMPRACGQCLAKCFALFGQDLDGARRRDTEAAIALPARSESSSLELIPNRSRYAPPLQA